MNTTQQILADLFKKAVKFQHFSISKISQGASLNLKFCSGSIRAQALQDLQAGDVIAFQTDQGNWYLIGTEQIQSNSTSQRTIISRVVRPNQIVIDYPILLLINVDLSGYIMPPDNNLGDFWLSGGKPKLKSLPSLNIGSEETVNFTTFDGFVMNLGNLKYIAATQKHNFIDDLYFNSDTNKRYYQYQYSILKSNSLTTFSPNLYFWIYEQNSTMQYLGNGIYQSFVEVGLGQIIANTNKKLSGAEQEPTGLPDFEEAFEGVYKPSFFTGDTYLPRLDAVALPDSSNSVIHDGIIESFPGSVTVESQDVSGYNILYWLRNKTITYTTWNPAGTSEFIYSAARSGTITEYTYIENIQGELLGLCFEKKYITQELNYSQTTNYIGTDVGDYYTYERSFDYSSTSNIYLKTINSSESLQLNSSGKFLVINETRAYDSGDNVTEIDLTKTTTSFSFKVIEIDINYSLINSGIDVSSYVGESVIVGYIDDNDYKPILIKGEIFYCNYSSSTKTFIVSVNITSVISLLHSVGEESLALPFQGLLLDNGCFWNYYLSAYKSGWNADEDIAHPYVYWGNNEGGESLPIVWKFGYRSLLNKPRVLCDQTIPIIHLSPISRYTIRHEYSERVEKILPSYLLKTDNLVGNKIYRVCDFTVNSYLSSPSNSTKRKVIAQWDIDNDGNIFYKKTFLVESNIKYPYNNGADANGYVVNAYSYHP